jgi:hypothetical protein
MGTVEPDIRSVVRANGHTIAAVFVLGLITAPECKTLFRIDDPFLCAPQYLLITLRNGAARATEGALSTDSTEFLNPYIYWPVPFKRDVGGHGSQPDPGAVIRRNQDP